MSMDFDYIDRMLIVRINGDIDHHSCEGIRAKIDKEIAKRSPRAILFDMEQVGFMDSSGIGVLIGRYKLISGGGGKAGMINVKPQIKRLCEICGLQKIIKIYPSKKQAISSIKE
ncbi:MAG: anti-sigma F factor antagonist [Gracilibacteraceae bacterium]|jgi:stage II sporulation protein AA (anti-sigma F factor antagonist)|nr:anti-sigma F factor antagonist [Gracilibacteraceae bacterium]